MVKYNEHQQRVVDDAANTTGNAIVVARAGSGKTTTVAAHIAALDRNRAPNVWATSFSTDAVGELAHRVNHRTVCTATIHSEAFAWMRYYWPHVVVDKGKAKRIIEDVCKAYKYFNTKPRRRAKPGESIPLQADPEWSAAIRKLTTFAKNTLTDASSVEAMSKLAFKLGLPYDLATRSTDPTQRASSKPIDVAKQLAVMAKDAMESMLHDTDTIDYDDMMWMAVMYQMSPSYRYQHIVVDELQDLNRAQMWIVQRALDTNGRLVGVGDDRQSIYQWRGADANAMNYMIETLGGENNREYGLPVTYRCAKSIVEYANQWVPDLVARDDAPEGSVDDATWKSMLERADEGDYILGRFNRDVVRAALGLMRIGKRARVAGKDYATRLRALLSNSPSYDYSGTLTWLGEEAKALRDALDNEGSDEDAIFESIDRYETLAAIVSSSRDLNEAARRLDNIFDDDGSNSGVITCSTIHRSKGQERNRVWVVDWKARKPGVEDDNLRYVAATRAKDELYIVEQEKRK